MFSIILYFADKDILSSDISAVYPFLLFSICGNSFKEATTDDDEHYHIESGKADEIIITYTRENPHYKEAREKILALYNEIEALKLRIK